jgi:hypothetical protein
MSEMTFERFLDRFNAYAGLPHQKDGLRLLYESIRKGSSASELREDAKWATIFSPPSQPSRPNPLPVAYFAQGDNGPEGWRECQPTAVSMCLNYLRVRDPFGPGVIDDNAFVKLAKRYGDVTSQVAVSKALDFLKVKYRFTTTCTVEQAKQEIDNGRPLAIGMLHHGPVTRPTGGGHYITIIGYNDKGWIVHDPYGEQDLVNGGFVKVGGLHGMRLQYSYKNTNPRWTIEGPNSGWAWIFN